MLDIQFIREHTDIVKESQRKRGESVELVDEVLSSDTARREALKAFEEARAQQKEIGKKVASAPADEKAKLIAATKELSQKVSEYKAAADAAAEEYTTAMWKLSNIVEPEAPEGGEDDYVVVKKVGQIRDFAAEGFEPKDHLTLGTGVAGIDMRRGVKVGGPASTSCVARWPVCRSPCSPWPWTRPRSTASRWPSPRRWCAPRSCAAPAS